MQLTKRRVANVHNEMFWASIGDKITASLNINDCDKAWDTRYDLLCNLLDIVQTFDASEGDSARITLRFPPHINYLGCNLSWDETSVRAFLSGALRWDLSPGQPQPGCSFTIINIDKIKDYGDTAIWQASQFWSRDI